MTKKESAIYWIKANLSAWPENYSRKSYLQNLPKPDNYFWLLNPTAVPFLRNYDTNQAIYKSDWEN